MGFTDSVAMNRTFYTIDQLQRDVLYVLPAKTPDATDFSAARFDPALERSPHLSQIFTSVNNVSLKRAGTNSLYVRGSRSRSALKSLPVGLIILDEEDEFEQEAIVLVRERIAGQREGARQVWHISTPSIPGNGINIAFSASTKSHFFFQCPHCSVSAPGFPTKPKLIELTFPDSLKVIGTDENGEAIASYICNECKAEITQAEKTISLRQGKWIAQSSSHIHGYQINQMYSPVISASNFQRAVALSTTCPIEEQEFHNNKLGEAHVVAGAAITDGHIDVCIGDYNMRDPKYLGGLITMGVDVGTKLHIAVGQWDIYSQESIDLNDNARPRLIFAGTVDSFDELGNIVYLFGPAMCVIDRQPETREAYRFARQYPRRVKLCHYTTSPQDLVTFDERVNANRTAWLDRTLGRILSGNIILPKDLPDEFRAHFKSLVRQPSRDNQGNVTNKYVNQNNLADHGAHALNYMEIALGCISGGEVQSTGERHQ
jgi:hypothetical protein